MRCAKRLSCREHENHDIAFCKASTHQGDAAAFNPRAVGRQCLPNCLIACTMTAAQKPSTWTTDTMDYILHEGDILYQHIDAVMIFSYLQTYLNVFMSAMKYSMS